MPAVCRIPECTFAETSVCLENKPANQCPNRLDGDAAAKADADISIPPPLTAPAEKPRFPPSLTLGTLEAQQLMSKRYCRIVGILGAPDSGKTASLASLFLLLGREKLSGFRFADSRTIMALNEISQGARRWNKGAPPAQMTSHTELADDRPAGFLHLRLRRNSDNAAFDFLLPDLPGEWSDSFIDKNRSDRLDFIKSADIVWIMVDGRQLSNLETRKTALRRLDLLVARLAALVGRPMPALLVISHRDSGGVHLRDLKTLTDAAANRNIAMDVVPIASFKRRGGESSAGFGIADLVAKTIGNPPGAPTFWPNSRGPFEQRAMLQFCSWSSRQ
jgi:Double-GTPase 2